MNTSQAAGQGLRERKKQQTREALSWAALRLAVDRGLGNVVVEDIAAEAGVSPRTYNNYFSSKAEAITWRHLNRARRTADLLRAQPPGEPLWEAITRAVVAQAGDEHATPEPEWIAGVRLMLSEPELQGEFLKASVAAERECAAVSPSGPAPTRAGICIRGWWRPRSARPSALPTSSGCAPSRRCPSRRCCARR